MAKLIDRLTPYLLLGIVGAAILYGLGRWDAAISERDRRLDEQTKTALATGAAWRDRYAAALEAAEEADSQLTRLQRERVGLISEADSIAGILDTLTARIQVNWRQAFELRTAELVRVRMALDTTRTALSLALRERDRWRALADSAYELVVPNLEEALRDEHEARKCTIMGIFNCPSRTTAFILGAAAGLVLSSAFN